MNFVIPVLARHTLLVSYLLTLLWYFLLWTDQCPPRAICVLFPGPCDCFTLHGRRHSTDRTLRWEDCCGLSDGPVQSESEGGGGNEILLALNLENGPTQGTQVPSRNYRKQQGTDFLVGPREKRSAADTFVSSSVRSSRFLTYRTALKEASLCCVKAVGLWYWQIDNVNERGICILTNVFGNFCPVLNLRNFILSCHFNFFSSYFFF